MSIGPDHVAPDALVGIPRQRTNAGRWVAEGWSAFRDSVRAQGVELLNWIAMRGALTGRVTKMHANYHVPISNTASALLVLENRATAELRKAG